MATTYFENIQKLYVAYFNRPADPAGLAYWETVVEAANGSTAAVSAEFANQAEYKTAYAGMTNAQIVDKVYQNLFGRPAEQAGKDYWAAQLDSHAITIDNVVAQVANGALTTDKAAYDAKVSFAMAFTAAVDTEAEIAGYQGDAANAAAKALVSGVKDAATLAAATAPATLNASVADVVKAGTPFEMTSALEAFQAATDAKADFLDAYDGDADGTIDPTSEAAIGTAVTTTTGDVDALITAGGYATASAAVKAALLADQVAINADALADAQAVVDDINDDIADVAGLTSAIAVLDAATTAMENADEAVTAAEADQAAKLASFNVLNGSALTVAADGTVTGKIVLDADNNLVLATGVKESTSPGVTALLAAAIGKLAADDNLDKAVTAEAAAQTKVDYFDMTAQEVTDLQAIKGAMVDVTVGTNALPTLAQIATQKAILDAKAGAVGATPAEIAAATAFDGLITTYNGHAGTNTLVSNLGAAQGDVDAAQDAIDALTEAVAAMNEAAADKAQLTALVDAIDAAGEVFTDAELTLPVNLAATTLATGASDIFVAGTATVSINLFGLLGNDSLFVGSGYTLNTGKLTTGSDSALEVFVTQSGTDTKVQIEQHAFSSHVTGAPANEIVTITLVGVNAADVHFDSNGIITAGTPNA